MSYPINSNDTPKGVLQNPFLKASRLASSPQKQNGALTPSGSQSAPIPTGSQPAPTPLKQKKVNGSQKKQLQINAMLAEDDKGDITTMEYVSKLAKELNDEVARVVNTKDSTKVLVIKLAKAVLKLEKEWKVLEETTQKAPETPLDTPIGGKKRGNSSPPQREKVIAKRSKRVEAQSQKPDENGWQTVKGNYRSRKPKPQTKEVKRVRQKPDALLIGADEGTTYAEILRKIRTDTKLKELGTQVVNVRKTRNGQMLFELKKDSTVKSTECKALVAEVLGDKISVRAMSQDVLIECRNLDEITTEDEVRDALKVQFTLGDIAQTAPIKMRNGYGSTQIATIKVPAEAANQLLKAGKMRVGWTVCPLQIPKQLLRCFKCLGFGHRGPECKGVNRSNNCWKCGGTGHKAAGCNNEPKCMLCLPSEGNAHKTGSFKCKAYKEALKKKIWK